MSQMQQNNLNVWEGRQDDYLHAVVDRKNQLHEMRNACQELWKRNVIQLMYGTQTILAIL